HLLMLRAAFEDDRVDAEGVLDGAESGPGHRPFAEPALAVVPKQRPLIVHGGPSIEAPWYRHHVITLVPVAEDAPCSWPSWRIEESHNRSFLFECHSHAPRSQTNAASALVLGMGHPQGDSTRTVNASNSSGSAGSVICPSCHAIMRVACARRDNSTP